jgi:hypothetical protein
MLLMVVVDGPFWQEVVLRDYRLGRPSQNWPGGDRGRAGSRKWSRFELGTDISSATTRYEPAGELLEGTLYYRASKISPRPGHDLVRHWQRDGPTTGIALFLCHHLVASSIAALYGWDLERYGP